MLQKYTPLLLLLRVAGVGVLAPTIACAATAQQGMDSVRPSADEIQVLIAAARHVRLQLTRTLDLGENARVLVDPTLPARGLTGAAGSQWSRETLQAISAAANLPIGDPGNHHVCPEQEVPSCKLLDLDAVISLGRPEVEGVQAAVPVRVIRRSTAAPDPQQAFRHEIVYVLEHRDGSWVVTGARRIGVI